MTLSLVVSIAIAVLAVQHLVLSYNVSRIRLSIRKKPDYNLDKELQKAIRAHGNAAEHNPLLVGLFVWLSISGSESIQNSPTLSLTVLALVLLRIIHSIGLLVVEEVGDRHPLRYSGALGTYLGFGILSFYLMLVAIEKL